MLFSCFSGIFCDFVNVVAKLWELPFQEVGLYIGWKGEMRVRFDGNTPR